MMKLARLKRNLCMITPGLTITTVKAGTVVQVAEPRRGSVLIYAPGRLIESVFEEQVNECLEFLDGETSNA